MSCFRILETFCFRSRWILYLITWRKKLDPFQENMLQQITTTFFKLFSCQNYELFWLQISLKPILGVPSKLASIRPTAKQYWWTLLSSSSTSKTCTQVLSRNNYLILRILFRIYSNSVKTSYLGPAKSVYYTCDSL